MAGELFAFMHEFDATMLITKYLAALLRNSLPVKLGTD